LFVYLYSSTRNNPLSLFIQLDKAGKFSFGEKISIGLGKNLSAQQMDMNLIFDIKRREIPLTSGALSFNGQRPTRAVFPIKNKSTLSKKLSSMFLAQQKQCTD